LAQAKPIACRPFLFAHMAGFILRSVLAITTPLQTAALHLAPARQHQHQTPNDAPIMMFAHGCSGSTVGSKLLGEMLAAHGIGATNMAGAELELLKKLEAVRTTEDVKESLPMLAEDIHATARVLHTTSMSERFAEIIDFTRQRNQILYFENQPKYMDEHYADLMEYLKQVNTRSVLFIRSNLMDVLHCRVTDFCRHPENEGLGDLVDQSGRETRCGFRGRSEDSTNDTGICLGDEGFEMPCPVKFDTDNLLQFLENQEKSDEEQRQWLSRWMGHTVEQWKEEFTYGELLNFEFVPTSFDPDGFERSLRTWSVLLTNLGFQPSVAKISKTLKAFGTRPAPSPSKDTIYNYQHVVDLLKDTKYFHMLRIP